jgi:N-acetylneuraminate synthase
MEIRITENIQIGEGAPVFVIAEIGINHNGSVEITKELIDKAVKAGAQAVKFQKRTPEICVPEEEKFKMRETPWGTMTYLAYKEKIEFGYKEYKEIDEYCKEKGIIWFASCWDIPSVEFIEQFNPPLYKAASASLIDHKLLKAMKDTGKPLIISTGMSTMEEIEEAVSYLGTDNLLIAHSTSAYPCSVEELNLKMIQTLQNKYPEVPIGYSGHETGLATTVATIALGATFVERHYTLDRAMWGTDHSASVEPQGLERMINDIRSVQAALGDGIKRVYASEENPKKKLRTITSNKTVTPVVR